jgi:Zn-dependent peptidase ImmA (M78 family)/DNA-binding XRE family transcriptional regulator
MNGERLRQARELCGLTQQELADKLGIAQSAVAQIEAGLFIPSESLSQSIAIETGFELSFLTDRANPVDFPTGSLLYRGRAKVSAKDKAGAHRFAQTLFEISIKVRKGFRPIPVSLPRLKVELPAAAARILRSHLGLSPDTPIANITLGLERAGVVIIHVPLEIDGLDGFSAWIGDIPMIALVGTGGGYRNRYTLSEEVGHLVMHAPLIVSVEEAEKEVKPFVGEFILPEEAMRREMLPPITLSSLASLRHKWGASIQFLAMRANALGVTTANQHRYLMQQMSSWRSAKKEPGDGSIQQEQPQLLKKLMEATYKNAPDSRRLRRDFGIPMSIMRPILKAQGVAIQERSPMLELVSKGPS